MAFRNLNNSIGEYDNWREAGWWRYSSSRNFVTRSKVCSFCKQEIPVESDPRKGAGWYDQTCGFNSRTGEYGCSPCINKEIARGKQEAREAKEERDTREAFYAKIFKGRY